MGKDYQVDHGITASNLQSELNTALNGDNPRDLVGLFIDSSNNFIIVSQPTERPRSRPHRPGIAGRGVTSGLTKPTTGGGSGDLSG